MSEWNPRYLAYCRAQGRGPDEQLARDRERWPGGRMTGYVLWVGRAWSAFEPDPGRRHRLSVADGGQEQFDRWLAGAVESGEAARWVEEVEGG